MRETHKQFPKDYVDRQLTNNLVIPACRRAAFAVGNLGPITGLIGLKTGVRHPFLTIIGFFADVNELCRCVKQTLRVVMIG